MPINKLMQINKLMAIWMTDMYVFNLAPMSIWNFFMLNLTEHKLANC